MHSVVVGQAIPSIGWSATLVIFQAAKPALGSVEVSTSP